MNLEYLTQVCGWIWRAWDWDQSRSVIENALSRVRHILGLHQQLSISYGVYKMQPKKIAAILGARGSQPDGNSPKGEFRGFSGFWDYSLEHWHCWNIDRWADLAATIPVAAKLGRNISAVLMLNLYLFNSYTHKKPIGKVPLLLLGDNNVRPTQGSPVETGSHRSSW